MKRTTKKLSGIGLELFLTRYYASYQAIDDDFARKLAADGVKTFSSVRVRRIAWCTWRRNKIAGNPTASPTIDPSAKSEARAAADVPAAQVVPAKPTSTSAETGTAFDPYEIGLLPIYQREGADGLLAKLADVSSIEHLRKMARAQQIALPTELRAADAAIEDIRSAIVAAVGKRIANRRAAAG